MAEKELKEQIDYTSELMENIMEDTSVPRNIRKAIEEAKEKIQNGEKDMSINITSAIYMMEDVSNDINMPAHTRTEIWTIISELEAIREKYKG